MKKTLPTPSRKYRCPVLSQFLSLFSIFLLILTGCKQDNEALSSYSGDLPQTDTVATAIRVVQSVSLIPIAGVDVFLFRSAPNGDPIYIDYRATDEDGWVHWSAEDSIEMVCAESPENYYGTCDGGAYTPLHELYQGYMYWKTAHAWLKLSVVDDEPLNPEIIAIGYVTTLDNPPYNRYISPVEPPAYIHWTGDIPRVLHLFHITDITESAVLAFDTLVQIAAFDTIDVVYHY